MAMGGLAVQIYNAEGFCRVVSTKPMPGTQWIRALTNVGCRVEASGMQNIIIIVAVVVVVVFFLVCVCFFYSVHMSAACLLACFCN
jgi:hydroxypyruvate reductase 1